jgi:periplasmic protein TonB
VKLRHTLLVALSAVVHGAVVVGALLLAARWSGPAVPVVVDLVEWLRVPERTVPDEAPVAARERPPRPGPGRHARGQGPGITAPAREAPPAPGSSRGTTASPEPLDPGAPTGWRSRQETGRARARDHDVGREERAGARPTPDRSARREVGPDVRHGVPNTATEERALAPVDREEPEQAPPGLAPAAPTIMAPSAGAAPDREGAAPRDTDRPATTDAQAQVGVPPPGSRVAVAGGGRSGEEMTIGGSGAFGGNASASPGTGGGPGDGRGMGSHDYTAYLRAFRQRLQESLHYPLAARRQGLTGTVELEVVVESSGRVRSVRVVSSSSHRMLDEAAVASIAGMTPLPLPRGVPARPLQIRVPLLFDLR